MNLIVATILGRCACAIACVIVAGAMAINAIPGWGWLLFMALLMVPSVSWESKKDEA